MAASTRVQRCIGEERYQRILDSVLTLDSDALAASAAECVFDNSWLNAKKTRVVERMGRPYSITMDSRSGKKAW